MSLTAANEADSWSRSIRTDHVDTRAMLKRVCMRRQPMSALGLSMINGPHSIHVSPNVLTSCTRLTCLGKSTDIVTLQRR